MSPKKLVGKLSGKCTKIVSSQLILALSDYEGRNHKIAENYISSATNEIAESLLKDLLNSANLDAATRYNCLDILLRRDIKELTIGIFPHSYYEAILSTILDKGSGIQYLNLKGVWVHEYPDLLCQVIRVLKKLKVLIIPHMANDELLQVLKECSSLIVLDVSGECYFTTDQLAKFTSQSLSILSIGYFGKRNICVEDNGDFRVVAKLIQNLPNLDALKTYSFTGKALVHLNKFCPSYKTRLKYLHDTGTDLEALTVIIKMCPDMEFIHLDTPDDGVLINLAQLPIIQTIKLTKFNIREFLVYLKISGRNIDNLKLSHVKDTPLDLIHLTLLAPNIKNLEFYQMNLTISRLDLDFPCLECIEILYSDINDLIVKSILISAPMLKKIRIGSSIPMTDGDIFRLCAESSLSSLEEIWFSCARGLTLTSVKLLMNHCPMLKILGQLNGWDVQEEQIEELRYMIKSSNIELELHY